MNITSIIVLLAFLAMIASPYFLRRFSRADTDAYGAFAIGSRNFGWFRLCAGLSATFVGGAAVINLASLGYSFGWYGLADVIPTTCGLVLSAFIIVPMLFKRRSISLGGYLEGSGRVVNAATGLLSTVVYTLISAAQIVALVKVVQPYFNAPAPVLALVAAIGVAAYLLYGGYSSVTVTDVIQFIVMGLGYFALVGGTLLFASPDSTGDPIPAAPMPLDTILLLALPLLFVPVSQDLHIRVNSAVNQRAARTGVLSAAAAYFTFGMISVIIGITMASSGVALDSPDDAVPTFLANHFGALSVIPTIAIICVVVSTLDSVMFAAASSLSYDFWDKLNGAKREKDSAHPRIATLVVLGIALLIALQAPQILRLILSALVIYVAVLLPMLAGRHLRKNGTAVGIVAIAVLIVVTTLEAVGFAAPFRAFLYAGIHLVVVMLLPRAASDSPAQS